MSELGQVLKDAREQKSYSLDDLQEETKIQKRYLQAIEEGNYSQLPGEFYTRAFIKSYAEAVGLDFKTLAEQYPGDMPSLDHPQVDMRVVPPSGTEGKHTSRSAQRDVVRARNWSTFVNRAIIVIFILIALMIVYIFVTHLAGNQPDRSGTSGNSNQIQYKGDSTSSAASSSSSSHSGSSSSSSAAQVLKKENTEGSTTTYTLSGTDKFDVTVSAAADQKSGAWFMATDGDTGKQIVQGIVALNGKKEYTFDASGVQTLRLRFGNVPGTKLQINGEDIAFPGTSTVQTLLIHFSK